MLGTYSSCRQSRWKISIVLELPGSCSASLKMLLGIECSTVEVEWRVHRYGENWFSCRFAAPSVASFDLCSQTRHFGHHQAANACGSPYPFPASDAVGVAVPLLMIKLACTVRA